MRSVHLDRRTALRADGRTRPLCGRSQAAEEKLLAAEGAALGLCCHPYDLCTALIAEELGIILTAPDGGGLDAPLAVEPDVGWVGYANATIQSVVGPALQRALTRRGLLRS